MLSRPHGDRSPRSARPAPPPGPSRRSLLAVAALLVWLVALALSQRIPPMQSPDEHSHLARAYALCQGQWLLETPPGESSGARVDRNLGELMHVSLRLARDASLRLTPEQSRAVQALAWSGDEAFLQIPGTGYYLPLIYLPQAAGLCLGRALGLPVLTSYQVARALTLTVSLLWVVAAIRLHSPGPLALLVLALPMSLFQWLSPTVDGLAHALTLWVACAFVRLHGQGAAAPLVLRMGWLLALASVAAVRPYLLPLFVLPAVIGWKLGRRSFALAAVSALAAVLCWYAWAASAVVDQRVARSVGLGEVVRHYAAQPGLLWSIIRTTLTDGELQTFYARSFVGILGWLDTLLPLWAYPTLWVLLAATALLSVIRGLAGEAEIWLLVAASASAPLVFAAMLLGWSPFPAQRIEGVQGRYFIAPVLLAAVALSPAALRSPARWQHVAGRMAIGLASLGALVGAYALLVTLGQRYH